MDTVYLKNVLNSVDDVHDRVNDICRPLIGIASQAKINTLQARKMLADVETLMHNVIELLVHAEKESVCAEQCDLECTTLFLRDGLSIPGLDWTSFLQRYCASVLIPALHEKPVRIDLDGCPLSEEAFLSFLEKFLREAVETAIRCRLPHRILVTSTEYPVFADRAMSFMSGLYLKHELSKYGYPS